MAGGSFEAAVSAGSGLAVGAEGFPVGDDGDLLGAGTAADGDRV